jgi:hypothetical protein
MANDAMMPSPYWAAKGPRRRGQALSNAASWRALLWA